MMQARLGPCRVRRRKAVAPARQSRYHSPDFMMRHAPRPKGMRAPLFMQSAKTADMPANPPLRPEITGLVLAGGQGRRMDGQDKGLLAVHGRPLALWTLERLAPQVGGLGISANRHLQAYRQLGVPVWPDATPGFDGPLAGIAAGLAHCGTPYLAIAPCDTPCFPPDLVERLGLGLAQADAELALAATATDGSGTPRVQPVFCLLRAALLPSLRQFLAEGGRGVEQWARRHRLALVHFEQAEDFAGANTPAELAALSRRLPAPQSLPSGNGPKAQK